MDLVQNREIQKDRETEHKEKKVEEKIYEIIHL
jgi:hypothetical protein